MGISMPKIGISKHELTSTKSIALGTLAGVAVGGGLIAGLMKGHPLKFGLIGAAIGAAAIGAALLGNASSSQRDGWCTSAYNDPDCDYPGTPNYPGVPDYGGSYDPGYRDDDGDGAREDYPDTGTYYPSGGTSYGDD